MLYMTMPEFAFFMGLTSYVIRDVFSKGHSFIGSKRLYIIGSIVIGFLLFLLYLHDEMNLNDICSVCRNRFLQNAKSAFYY